MMFMKFSEEQHVIARTDLDGWLGPLGYPAVRKGTRGIIRTRPTGFLNDRYTVEFHRSGTASVRGRDLKPAMSGGGESSWRRYQETRQGISLGLFGSPGVIVGEVKRRVRVGV